jgi:hypothetical protein
MKIIALKTVISKKTGMTIAELLIALALVVLVMATLAAFLGFIGKFWRNADNLASKQDQARLIINGLRNDLGTALDLYIVPLAPSAEEMPPGYGAYYVASGRLTRRDTAGEAQFVHSNTSFDSLSVVFTYVGPSVLKVEVYIESENMASTEILLQNAVISSGSLGHAVVYIPID